MKRIAIFSIFVLCTAAITTAFIRPDCLQQHWGTKKLYEPADTGNTPPPAGYVPFFINHIGRHGARHLTSLNDLQRMQQVLKDAAAANALTSEGVTLESMVEKLLIVEKKDDCGLLTVAGQEEQKGIGVRMRAHYPALFNNPATYIEIVTTREKRTKQSAASFMQGLQRPMQDGQYTRLSDNDSIHLRFFEVSPGYKKFKKKGDWIAEMNKLEQSARAHEEPTHIIHKFFKEDYVSHMLNKPTDTPTNGKVQNPVADIIDGMFNIATLSNVTHAEIMAAGFQPEQLDIRSLFTCDEFAWLEFVSSAQDFLQKGPGTDENGIQVRNAVPLLVDFIKRTDSAIQMDKPALIGRFAHAETIAPFASLLEIKGAATPTSDIFNYDKVWNVSSIMGFSTNIQWVLYQSKDREKDVLIKILYNEKPVEIPVNSKLYPYYRWADVRAFYMAKLNRLNVNPDTNMLDYLMSLK